MAESARRRKEAIKSWHKEETRLATVARMANVKACGDAAKNSADPQRRVSWSENMLITSIPAEHDKLLPPAVASPLQSLSRDNNSEHDSSSSGSDDCGDDDNDSDEDFTPKSFARFLRTDEGDAVDGDSDDGKDSLTKTATMLERIFDSGADSDSDRGNNDGGKDNDGLSVSEIGQNSSVTTT
jgi:hypothetical protein